MAMSNFQFNQLPDQNSPPLQSADKRVLEQQLAKLEHSHSLRYQVANLEIWALVGTMDDIIPGFWSRFMFNRQVAFKEFLQQKKTKRS
jgi:hypothetical protein